MLAYTAIVIVQDIRARSGLQKRRVDYLCGRERTAVGDFRMSESARCSVEQIGDAAFSW